MKKPNILFLLIDGLRADSLGCTGYTHYAISPALDKLAKESHIFTQAYTTINATDPSITSMMAGTAPYLNGLMNHGFQVTQEEIDTYQATIKETLPEFLQKEGYETASLDWLSRWHKRGYDSYPTTGRYTEAQKPEAIFPTKSFIKTKILPKTPLLLYSLQYVKLKLNKIGKNLPFETAEVQTNNAIKLLKERKKDKPFYLFVHYWDIHTPHQPHKKYLHKTPLNKKEKEHFDKELEKQGIKNTLTKKVRQLAIEEQIARCGSSVSYIDAHIGRLLKELQEQGYDKNTIIIVTADHGENFFENNIYFDHHGLYEPTLKVPLIIRFPDKKHKKIQGLVQGTDIYPTIKKYLGKEVNKNLSGKDLLGKKKRDSIVFEEYYSQKKRGIRMGKYKYIKSLTPENLICSYCHVAHGTAEELYDLEKDPLEGTNIVKEEPKEAEKLKKELEKAFKKQVKMKKKDKEKELINESLKDIQL